MTFFYENEKIVPSGLLFDLFFVTFTICAQGNLAGTKANFPRKGKREPRMVQGKKSHTNWVASRFAYAPLASHVLHFFSAVLSSFFEWAFKPTYFEGICSVYSVMAFDVMLPSISLEANTLTFSLSEFLIQAFSHLCWELKFLTKLP